MIFFEFLGSPNCIKSCEKENISFYKLFLSDSEIFCTFTNSQIILNSSDTSDHTLVIDHDLIFSIVYTIRRVVENDVLIYFAL